MPETKPRVLFVCTHNAARSQMAEGLLRHSAGERFETLSAGHSPPRCIRRRARCLPTSASTQVGCRLRALTSFLPRSVSPTPLSSATGRRTTVRALVVRQGSSGTTYAFTNHLSAISDEWRDRGPGVGRLLQWPGNAMAARGNEGVAGRIKLSRGARGYVEYGVARRAGLTMAWLENKAGEFVQPHGGSGLASLLNMEVPENFRVFEPDPAGEDSYPIVTYSWLLLYRHYDETKAAALKDYITWCLTDGQEFSESLGFVRLPPRVVSRAVRAVGSIP
jgi:hypothetical protein